MADAVQYFLLGSSFMFSALIAWIFWRKGNDMLSRLVTALMIVMAVGFLKDTFMMLIFPPTIPPLRCVFQLLLMW